MSIKKDRTARLLNIIYLLNHNPQGLTPSEIAKECGLSFDGGREGVSVRTVYRDLKAIQDEMAVPVWVEKGKWKINPGHFLPPIQFNLSEAMTIFIAARLLLSYSSTYNPSVVSTFMKLNSIMPAPLRDQIRKTTDWMQKQEKNRSYLNVMDTLARAWAFGQRAKITYWVLGEAMPAECIVEPYFIQPACTEHANYLIAYCHLTQDVRTYQIERITSVMLLNDLYTVPQDFDGNEYLKIAKEW